MNKTGYWLAGLAWLVAVPALAGGPGAWTTLPTPNATDAPTELFAVSCVAASDCWALGNAGGGFDLNTAAMHWDGSSWRAVPSPLVDPEATHLLEDVACTSTSNCWAVGYYFELESFELQPLVLHWDGSSWKVDASLGPGSGWSRLNGVSCVSASECWAVGSDAGGGSVKPMIARWASGQWRIQSSPTTGAALAVLHDVACASTADCWAVGSAGAATSTERTLALHWNGIAWSAAASPNAASGTENVLSSVTCNGALSCFAVGHSSDGASHSALALQWAGASWASMTIVAAPGSEGYELAGVSCASATDCWAVGHSTDSGIDAPVRLHYTGIVGWLPAVEAPATGPSYGSAFNAVTCIAGSQCWAVGTTRPAEIARARIDRWDGTSWSTLPAPAGSATQSNMLRGMTCLSGTECWAVGMYFSGSVAVSLVQHWDGVSWQIVPSPNTAPDRNNYLQEINCTSASDCWAVGSTATTLGTEGQPLALHWDGSAWSIVEVQTVDTHAVQDMSLTGVDCINATDCWAVGHVVEQYYRSVLLHWDGTAWTPSVAPHQGLPSEGNALYGITCIAADDCTAVGDQWTANGPYGSYYTVILHWDGTSWSLMESPLVSTERDNRLFSVACPAADDCWAVGNAYHENGDKSLVMHWNGTAWQLADPPPGLGFLYDLSCAASDNCWAVGHPWKVEGGEDPQTFSAHWDGSRWSAVATPKPGRTSSLDAVACTAEQECWAVGSYSVAGSAQTLALKYAPPPNPHVDPFAFTGRTGVATNVYVTSETRTVTGFTGTLPISIDNDGQYRVGNGAWTAAAGQIAAGSTLAVRHVSASSAGTEKISNVAVGPYSTPFRTVTSAEDRTPDAFDFGTKAGVEPATAVESDPRTPANFNAATSLVPGPGLSYRIDAGAWTTASGALQPGQSLQVRHVSSSSSLGYTKTYIKVGGVTAYFTTRTK